MVHDCSLDLFWMKSGNIFNGDLERVTAITDIIDDKYLLSCYIGRQGINHACDGFTVYSLFVMFYPNTGKLLDIQEITQDPGRHITATADGNNGINLQT